MRTALALAHDHRFHVTLISDHTDFRYYPSLYHTATGGRRMLSSIPLNELFEDLPIQLLNDKMVSIDRQSRTITTEVKHVVSYDALVLALGVKTNYFGIKGLEEYSYGIKTNADAETLKKHLHEQFLANRQPDYNYVVVGAGPTGVELAGILPTYLGGIAERHGVKHGKIHVDLVEAAPRVLPRMPKDVSRSVARRLRKLGVKLYLGVGVQAQDDDELMLNNKKIMSHTVIWTAGVANHPFYAKQGFQLSPNGKVRVDQYLQAEHAIYVIGDNADTPYSGMAQTALYDGVYVARNLQRLADKKDPKPYTAKKPVYVVPTGHKWAAVLWGRFRIYGWLGWQLRRFADLLGYHDYEPWYKAGTRWMAESDPEEPCPVCSNL